MHELPATRGMLEVALESASDAARRARRDPGDLRIREIHLVVGELTSIVDDSVQFYFDILARGTAAEGAELVFRREPARLRCLSCGHREEVVPPLAPACPTCGSLRLEVTGGQAFRVQSLEVDGLEGDDSGDGASDGLAAPPGEFPATAFPGGGIPGIRPSRMKEQP